MEIGAKATQVFGSATLDSVFTAGQSAAPTPAQEIASVTIRAHRREINRIRGYKLELTPAENQQLVDIRAEVQEIEQKTAKGTVRQFELDKRLDLLKEADEIIGKPIVDIEADEFLANLAGILEALLEPKLNRVEARRVETLERIKEKVQLRFESKPDNSTLRAQLRNLIAQIGILKVPRSVSSLSPAERKTYDDLTKLINDHAGVKVQLTSREAIRVADLEKSIIDLQGQLPPDISTQPTPQAVSRAYARLI